jgi:hypothetical protein
MELSFEEIAVYLHCGGNANRELRRRTMELAAEAPLQPRGIFLRDGDRFLLCGTIGGAFERWHRRLSAVSAADALIAQAIGTAAVEKTMDALEAEIKAALAGGETLQPRRSPGYGKMKLAMNREIIERLDAAKRIGVSFTDSMTLLPSKSVTAVCEVKK